MVAKREFTKKELGDVLMAVLEHPVEQSVNITKRAEPLYREAINAKETLVHLTIQSLIEQNDEGVKK